jgi:DNA-binding response OmpR family regulator
MVRVQVGNVPTIFLTAHRSRHELLAGFAAGADDYVTKPCDHEELLARVRAVLQRTAAGPIAPGEVVTIGEVTLDAARHEVLVRGAPVALSPKEFALLWLLAVNAGRVVQRPLIIDSVWGADFYGDPKALDVYIRLLRRKIEVDPDHPRLIETVRGVGYCFAAPATRVPPEGGTPWLAAGT